jgi:hypothetical protein
MAPDVANALRAAVMASALHILKGELKPLVHIEWSIAQLVSDATTVQTSVRLSLLTTQHNTTSHHYGACPEHKPSALQPYLAEESSHATTAVVQRKQISPS